MDSWLFDFVVGTPGNEIPVFVKVQLEPETRQMVTTGLLAVSGAIIGSVLIAKLIR